MSERCPLVESGYLRRRCERAKWDVQRIDEAGPFIGELHLPIQLLAEGPHHSGAEALPYRWLNRRTSAFSPDKVKPLLWCIDRPRDFDPACGNGESAKFGGIGAELIQGHRKRN